MKFGEDLPDSKVSSTSCIVFCSSRKFHNLLDEHVVVRVDDDDDNDGLTVHLGRIIIGNDDEWGGSPLSLLSSVLCDSPLHEFLRKTLFSFVPPSQVNKI